MTIGPPLAGRIRPLDTLRGLAVLLVLFRHGRDPYATIPDAIALPFRWARQVGWVGVDLFLVLSGFLVSGLLFQEYQRHGRIAPGRFLVRRGFKIYPGFYLLLMATTAVWWLYDGGFGPDFWRWFLAEAFYVQNYAGGAWSHTWSLAVEEHFYFLLAAATWLAARRGGDDPFRRVPVVVLGLAVMTLAMRSWVAWTSPFVFETHVFATHLRLDALGFGVLLAYAHHFHHAALQGFVRRHRTALFGFAALGFAVAAIGPLERTPFLVGPGFLILSVASVALLAAVVLASEALPQGGTARYGPLARIGVYSYSIYLWHLATRQWIAIPLNRAVLVPTFGEGTVAFLLEWAVYAAGTFAVGIGMARLVEFPVIAVRDRWFPSRTAPANLSSSPRV